MRILSSWKEISAFLRRSVRTVQRWEQQYGMPVRRYAQGNGSVYIAEAELVAWLTGKDGVAAQASQDVPEIHVLTSWKEIASYVNRSVRTVQRWEEAFGFPVRRLHGDEGSVYALKEEVDTWLRSAYAERQLTARNVANGGSRVSA